MSSVKEKSLITKLKLNYNKLLNREINLQIELGLLYKNRNEDKMCYEGHTKSSAQTVIFLKQRTMK